MRRRRNLLSEPNRLRKNSIFDARPPKGAIDFEGLAVSLKRYPDTKREFFRSLPRYFRRAK